MADESISWDEDVKWDAPKPIAIVPGQQTYADDEALTAKYRGVVPDEVKTFAKNAGNAALFYAPRAASAVYSSFSENKPLKQAWEEEKALDEARSRQSPKASMAGTGFGAVAGLAVPLGPIGTLGKAAEAATAARFGATAGKIAEGATVGSVLSGASGAIGTLDPREALKDAAIGAGVGGAAAPVIGALGNYFTKLPAVVDSAGKLAPEAQNAIRTAFEGRMSPESIKSFESELVAAFEKKGISPEVAKEALLAKEGVTPTRSLVTGEAAPKVTEDIGARAAMEGEQNLSQKVEKLIGTPPERTAVAEALGQKTGEAVDKAGQKYETLKSMGGQFGAESGIEETFIPYAQKALLDAGKPSSFVNTNQYPQAKAALNWLNDGPAKSNFVHSSEGLTPKNIQATLQEFNKFRSSASGDDYHAVNAIKQGFLQSIQDHIINPAMFDGKGAEVLQAIKEAPEAWRAMKSTYFPDVGGTASSKFKATVQSFVDTATNKISANPTQGMLDTAQSAINAGVMSPKFGSKYYENLEKALGTGSPEMETVKKHIRSLALDTGGDLSKLPKKLDDFLKDSPTLAQKVFKPEELSQLRRLSETARLITQRPIPQQEKDDLIAKAVGKAIRLGAAGIGQLIHGPMGAFVGYLGTRGAEKTTEALSTGIKRRAETAGASSVSKAPKSLRVFDKAPETGSLVRNVEAFDPVGVSGYQEPTMLPPLTINRDRTARASGGRISDKLVVSVERAKKLVNNATKPLLNADDTHIARALEIANQNFEG